MGPPRQVQGPLQPRQSLPAALFPSPLEQVTPLSPQSIGLLLEQVMLTCQKSHRARTPWWKGRRWGRVGEAQDVWAAAPGRRVYWGGPARGRSAPGGRWCCCGDCVAHWRRAERRNVQLLSPAEAWEPRGPPSSRPPPPPSSRGAPRLRLLLAPGPGAKVGSPAAGRGPREGEEQARRGPAALAGRPGVSRPREALPGARGAQPDGRFPLRGAPCAPRAPPTGRVRCGRSRGPRRTAAETRPSAAPGSSGRSHGEVGVRKKPGGGRGVSGLGRAVRPPLAEPGTLTER